MIREEDFNASVKAIDCANVIIARMSDYIRAVCYEDITYVKAYAAEARVLLKELLRMERDLEKELTSHYVQE